MVYRALSGIVIFALCFVLVALLIAAPVVYTATELAQADVLMGLLDTVDLQSPEAVAVLEEMEDMEVIGLAAQLVQTEVGRELIGLYLQDLFGAMEPEGTYVPQLTPETLKALGEEHIDVLVPIVHELVRQEYGGLFQLSDEEAKMLAMTLLAEGGDAFLSSLPTAEMLGYTGMTIPENPEEWTLGLGIACLHNRVLMDLLLFAVAVLAALILLLRLRKFRGFVPLVIVGIISAGTVACVLFMYGGQIVNSGLLPAALIPPIKAVIKIMWQGVGSVAACTGICAVILVAGKLIFDRS